MLGVTIVAEHVDANAAADPFGAAQCPTAAGAACVRVSAARSPSSSAAPPAHLLLPRAAKQVVEQLRKMMPY